jgi:hypothetical protein
MSSEMYRVDKAELQLQKELRVAESLQLIEDKPMQTPKVFIISTFEFIKLRERKTETDIQQLLWLMMVKIAAHGGFKNTIDDFTKQDIVKMIFYSHSDLTVEEIWKAFELERYREYEEKTEAFQLFNADYVSAILKKYKGWKLNIKQQHNISFNMQQTLLPEVSDVEKVESLKQGTLRRFEEFQQTKKIEEPCSHIFDYLFEKGIIKQVTEKNPKLFYYYQEKLKVAEAQIKKELEGNRSSGIINKTEFLEQIEKISEQQSSKAQIRAKKLILVDFFNKQIELKTDLETLLK